MEFKKIHSGSGQVTTFYLFTGNLPSLVEKLELSDRILGLSYNEYQTLIPLMEKKFNKRLHHTYWGSPSTVFFC